MKYRISIPATSANLGPGFDSLGLALGLHNVYEVDILDADIQDKPKVTFDLSLTGCEFTSDENFIASAMAHTAKKYALKNRQCHVKLVHCDIPVSRGLGSSAAAIVAGVAIAGLVGGAPLSIKQVMETATEIEGHPDNVVPACLGNLTVSITNGEEVLHSRISLPDELGIAVLIPDFKLSTKEARQVLPDNFSRSECIYNISRASLLIAAMANKEYHLLEHATEDCIHQPYRMSLIPDGAELIDHAKSIGALASFISGAGPTLLAFYHQRQQDFCERMSSTLYKQNNGWRLIQTVSDSKGLDIQEIH